MTEKPGTKKYIMHVISGSHWDREWRHTAEQSKLRLADIVDSVLDTLEKKQSFKAFCLDGGTIVIEDYLTIRPENEKRIKSLIKAGRIMIINWYTLPDMFTVAPECIIRNMLIGRQMAQDYGGAMKSGYTPFSYGQVSQLPQIYQDFGISTAMFYRGTNRYELPSLFLWEGKDGSALYAVRTFDDSTRSNWFFYPYYELVLDKHFIDIRYHYNREECPVHLCDNSLYERPFKLLVENINYNKHQDSLKAALKKIRSATEPYAVGNNLLALNIEDNAHPYEFLPEMIAALNTISDDIDIVQSTFDEYYNSILSDSRQLFTHKGELRFTGVAPGFNGLYGASHSSRIKLKIINDEAETWLIHYAEPLACFASMLGLEYPRTMLDRAWRFLLQNHAHDSICGAAVNQAHEDMLYRFSIAKTVGQEITARAIAAIYNKIDTKTGFNENDFIVTLFNTLAFEREGVVFVVIDLPSISKFDSPIDPCTGMARYDYELKYFDIIDTKGNPVEFKVLSRENIWISVESLRDTDAAEMKAIRWRMLIYGRIPPLGYATYAIRPREPRYVEHPRPSASRKLIARPNGVMENECLKLIINPNGTFSLLNKENGELFENLHYFADYGETGSAHKSSSTQQNRVITSHGCNARLSMLESSTLRGIYQIDINMFIPAAAKDAYERTREGVELAISSQLILEKGCKHLKIRTKLHNLARDHKLQVNFPTGLETSIAAVESAFAVDERDIRWKDTADNSEKCHMFQPMQNFVDLSDGRSGFAFLSKGLREYEIMDDDERTIAITLLRTHRAYMKANANMTSDELDKYTGSHCIGLLKYEYAIYPHSGNWVQGRVLQEAYLHKIDVKAILGVTKKGNMPPVSSMLTVEPSDKIMVSTIKESNDRAGIILRVWNMSPDKVNTSIYSRIPVRKVSRLRMDETFIEFLETDGTKFYFEINPFKIETFLVITARET